MSDQQITCSECGGVFVFTEAEQQFYATKGLAAPPKRCKTCRQARRAAREGGGAAPGGGGGFGGDRRGGPPAGGGGGGFGNRPRRFSNDVNEYRSPMTGGNAGGGGGWQARGPAGPRGPRVDRGPGGGGGAGGNFRGGPGARGPSGGGAPRFGSSGGGGGEYRSPSYPRERSPERSGERPAWGTGGDERPRRAPAAFNNAPRPERNGGGDRAPRARPEKPRFDITCAECGTQAQVPFKPLEGRQVFCQPCYRARKGTATPETTEATEGTQVTETDAGIVE